jgi:hypothetical protein
MANDYSHCISLKNYLHNGKNFNENIILINHKKLVSHKESNLKCFRPKIPEIASRKRSEPKKSSKNRDSKKREPPVLSYGGKSLEKKHIKKKDIYLYNSESFEYKLQKQLYKLYDKLTEARFSVKLIKNFEKLKALNTKKLISASSVFLSIVDRNTFYSDTFRSEILFAYESEKRIALIFLDEINTLGLDEQSKEIVDSSETFSFYKDQQALDKIIPIQFNSFLFQINNLILVKKSFIYLNF